MKLAVKLNRLSALQCSHNNLESAREKICIVNSIQDEGPEKATTLNCRPDDWLPCRYVYTSSFPHRLQAATPPWYCWILSPANQPHNEWEPEVYIFQSTLIQISWATMPNLEAVTMAWQTYMDKGLGTSDLSHFCLPPPLLKVSMYTVHMSVTYF